MSVVSKLYIGDNNNKAVPLQVSVADPALSDLIDTSIYAPTNGQLLQYNSVTQRWENADNEAVSDALTIDQAREAEVIEGKNLFLLTLESIKAITNNPGTWSGNVYSLGNATFTIVTNVDGYVEKIVINSTSNTNDVSLWLNFRGYTSANNMTGCIISNIYEGNTSQNVFQAYRIGNKSTGAYIDRLIDTTGAITIPLLTSEQDGSICVSVKAGATVSNVEYYPMICTLDEWNESHTYEPYYRTISDRVQTIEGKIPSTASSSNKMATASDIAGQKTLLKDTVGWTGKNRNSTKLTARTNIGITTTVDSNNIVTANGTVTARGSVCSVATFITEKELEDGKEYIVSDGSDGTVGLCAYVAGRLIGTNTYQDVASVKVDDTITPKFTTDFSTYDVYALNIHSVGGDDIGKIYTNYKLYPMIRDARILDDTYEPYHEDVVDVLREAEVIEGKNLCFGKLVQGVINAQGAYQTLTTRVCITDYIPVNAGDTYILSANTSLSDKIVQFSVHYYSAPSESAHTGYEPNWETTPQAFTIPSDTTAYIRFSVRVSDSSDVTPSDFNSLMLCTQEEWNKSHDYEPYYIPLKDAMFRREEQRVLGAKNLCYKMSVNVDSVTINGITWTRLNDGTIKANGTATAQSIFWSNGDANNFFEFDFSVRLNGAPSGSSNSTYHLGGAHVGALSVGDKIFAPNSPFSIACVVQSGVTVNNIIFKPMIRLASDPDDTYQPYAMTNLELTETTLAEVDKSNYRFNFAGAGSNITSAGILASYLKQGMGHIRFVDVGNLFGYGSQTWVKVFYMTQNGYGSPYNMSAFLIVSPLTLAAVKLYFLDGTSATSFTLTKISSLS